MPAPKTKSNDQEDSDYVGRKSQIMRRLRRALDDEDITAARKAVKAMDEDDASAKRARRAKRADDDELEDDEAKQADDDELDDDELDDDDTADEDDLPPGGAKRGKKARRAKRADADELDDDELDDDEAKKAYDDDEAWGKSDMKPFAPKSQFGIPRVGQRDVNGAKRGALTDNRLVRRAMQLTDRRRWMTVEGRYEAMMLAAEELGYRGPNV